MQQKNGSKGYVLIVSAVFLLGMIGWFVVGYNTLIAKEEQTKVAWAQVESTMQRKLDLIPNLVKTVKAYAKHESQLLQEVTKLRSQAMQQLQSKHTSAVQIATLAKLQRHLGNGIGKLIAVAEHYPELKSSEQFLQLQSQIEGAENRINITRMQFNEAVATYNAYLRTLPANIIASIGHFTPKAYFKAEDAAHKKLEIGL